MIFASEIAEDPWRESAHYGLCRSPASAHADDVLAETRSAEHVTLPVIGRWTTICYEIRQRRAEQITYSKVDPFIYQNIIASYVLSPRISFSRSKFLPIESPIKRPDCASTSVGRETRLSIV